MLTGNTPPSDSGQKYTVSFTMVPPLTPHDTDVSYEDAPWGVAIKFDNVSLSSIQKGLYWTTRNIDLLSGRQKSWRNIFSEAEWTSPWRYEFVRSWRLRDSTTEKPYRGWSGDVQLCVHSAETLSGFSLGKQLRRQNILFAYVTDEKTGKRVFNFDAERERSNVCHLPLGGKPFDLVWLWPMESVVPKGSGSGDDVEGGWGYCGIGTGTGTGTGGLAASWKDMVASVARSLGVRTVARAIVVLFLWSIILAVAILVMELAAMVVVAVILVDRLVLKELVSTVGLVLAT